ncbi:DUF320 domain-containing protein, partial [Arthrobacter sp. PO-11]|nr:DUF320 domain-containing protein [Arthrobacter cavernae]
TSGAHGILSGTQIVAPVSVPVTLGATSLAVLGDSTAINKAPAHAPAYAPAWTATTSGAHGILSGTQI